MLAYRLISGDSIFIHRSFCPHCKKTLVWYDLIPVLSWFMLRGRCRFCSASISWLYPCIELLTPLIFIGLFHYVEPQYWLAYSIFFSALLITIHTDLATMLISRFASLYLVPVGFAAAYCNLLPISLVQSILGACSAYAFLWLINTVFLRITGKIGMGQGDLDLLACIGAFTGILGWWISLSSGSLLGSLVGLCIILAHRSFISIKIPFGPFLALGAIGAVLFQEALLSFLFVQ